LPANEAGRAEVLFDGPAFNEDLGRASSAGRAAALAARNSYRREGCPVASLLACDEEALDATQLPGCVKVYLPPPAGQFGMVFAIERKAGRLLLAYLAFGVRHHPHDSHAPSVYQLAHLRLHR
jgi:hypothetical protein